MKALTSSDNYIFYLQLTPTPTNEFYQLAYYFNKWGISLVPVLPKDIGDFIKKSKRYHVIALLKDHDSYNKFQSIFTRYIKIGLFAKKICLHEFSSFKKREDAYQLERMKSYSHTRLPMDADEFVKDIVRQFYIEKQNSKSWPGAKRGRLPSLVSGV